MDKGKLPALDNLQFNKMQVVGHQPPGNKEDTEYQLCFVQLKEEAKKTKDKPGICTNITTGDTQLDKDLDNLLHMFCIDLPVGPPVALDIDHCINTKENTPVNKNPYLLSKEQLDKQSTQIEYLLEQGLIRPLSSAWGAPVLFVQKKDQS